MRIQRVVEVEHPGVDMGEDAWGFHSSFLCLSSPLPTSPLSSPRKRGPIPRNLSLGQGGRRLSQDFCLWLWVPDRARWARLSGTTVLLGASVPSRHRKAQRLASGGEVDGDKTRRGEAAVTAI